MSHLKEEMPQTFWPEGPTRVIKKAPVFVAARLVAESRFFFVRFLVKYSRKLTKKIFKLIVLLRYKVTHMYFN